MKRNIVKMSLVTAMLLTTGAYSAQIVGADVESGIDRTDNMQFGFGGLNMDNINVNLIAGEDNTITGTFNPVDGTYPDMADGDTVQSSVFNIGDDKSDEITRMGYISQKPWPLSEPMGLKVINNDMDVSDKGKPENCIMGSSYLNDEATNLTTGTPPTPVLCSSPAGSNKRFSLTLLPETVANTAPGAYGESVDLVFDLADPTDTNTTPTRYQVFQKVTNFTGMRLDGLKIEVLDENNNTHPELTLSVGIDEVIDHDGNPTTEDLFLPYEMAFYPPGLWGDGTKEHLPIGWFDSEPSGYYVNQIDDNKTLETAGRLDGNYVDIYGNWLPGKWTGIGMHEVLSALEEPVLLAYWGTHPDRPTEAPAWYYGMHDNDGVPTNFAKVTQDELDKWAAQPEKYVIDHIEDLPNLSWNYIVNVGQAIAITGGKFIIRFTPKVSVDQTPPGYISDDNITIIPPTVGQVPPTADAGPDVTVQVNETVTITGTGTDIDGTIDSYEWKYGTEVVATTASFDTPTDIPVGIHTLYFTVTDNDGLTATDSMNLTVTEADDGTPTDPDDGTATDPVAPPVYYPSSGGGGCTYNPNSNSFDMTFLMMIALGLLYPFRRRFLK